MSDRILNPSEFGLKIYDRFPPRYRVDDIDTNYSLRRYLDSCGEGGFKYAIEEQNGILDFVNPDQAPVQVLPVLFEQYGLPIFNGIPEQFLRYLLPRLGDAWSKKGSMRVVDQVVTSLTGIKTETVVTYDQYGNADVDIYLRMDVNLSDFFPNPAQFSRLIDKFLPFYLGKTLIYSFIFDVEGKLHGDDTYFHDQITQVLNEHGGIVSSGFKYTEDYNNPNKLVGSTLITNTVECIAPIPDEYFDVFVRIEKEFGTYDSVKSQQYYRSLWNNQKTNLDLITNDTIDTDGYRSKVLFTLIDIGTLKSEDIHEDHQVVVSTNQDDANVSAAATSKDAIKNVFQVIAPLDANMSEDISVQCADQESADLSAGDLNRDVLALISQDDADVSVAASNADRVKSVNEESATFVVVHPSYFLTNCLSHTTNGVTIGVPDSYDTVVYKDGTKTGWFSP